MKTINVNHRKIGEVILPVDENGRPKYDKQAIESIFIAGASALLQKKIITDSDKEILEYKIKDAKIAIIENLGSRIAYDYKYNILTGNVTELSISFDTMNSHLKVDDTINSLLSILCDISLSVLHPESNLTSASDDGSKGTEWERYALALLPEERVTNEIIEGKLRKMALDYFKEHVNPKLSELLAEEYGDDWEDILANDYAENVLSSLDDVEEFKNGDYMDVEGYIGDIIYSNDWEEHLS